MLSLIQLAVFVCGGWIVVTAFTIGTSRAAVQKGVLSKRNVFSSAVFGVGAWMIFFQSPIAKFLLTLLP